MLATVVVGRAPSGARADELTVPVRLQAELVVKVANYDRNLPERAAGLVTVLVVVRPSVPESEQASAQFLRAMQTFERIAGLPHSEEALSYAGPGSLAASIKAKKASIVYLPPGFALDEIASIAKALEGTSVLTVAGVGSFVPRGVVLGFETVSAKPRLLCHLGQARKQNVAFRAEVLKLMKVFE